MNDIKFVITFFHFTYIDINLIGRQLLDFGLIYDFFLWHFPSNEEN